MNNVKVAAISARFQVPLLTIGHEHLLSSAIEQNDVVVILLGGRKAQPCARNPFSFEVRKAMILRWYESKYPYPQNTNKVFLVVELNDSPIGHAHWSSDFDNTLQNVLSSVGVLEYCAFLYGSRDSFLSQYCGSIVNRVYVDEVQNTSGTAQRNCLVNMNPESMSVEFRSGIAYAHQQMYPSVMPTVDIAVISVSGDRQFVLMGKKDSYGNQYMFPGGHVDTRDESYEAAAQRELKEETGIDCKSFKYISSHRVDDYRYRGSVNKITTTLFLALNWHGNPSAADDLSCVEWVPLDKSILEKVCPHHIPIMESLLRYKDILK